MVGEHSKTPMQPGRKARTLVAVFAASLVFVVCGVIALRLMFSRTREFRAHAQAGQPIVQAIEAYRKQVGSYPPSLAELSPRYLPTLPEIKKEGHFNYGAWEYCLTTNSTAVSYTLRSYMGRGGVEYDPPHWIGNNEGSRKILMSNE